MIHPSGIIPQFDKENHKYLIDGKELLSVTQLIGKFFPKFKRDEISKIYAKKHGLTQEHVLAMWEDKRVRTKTIGDNCHLFASNFIDYLYGVENKKIIKPYNIRYGIVVDKIIELKEAGVLYPEHKIFSLKFNIAGTVDIVSINNHIVYLYDWKFVETIDINNPWENCNAPINYLSASKFNKFALQLNLYQFILETEGYFENKYFESQDRNIVYKKALLHVTDTDCIKIDVPDMKKEVKAIIIEREKLNGKK